MSAFRLKIKYLCITAMMLLAATAASGSGQDAPLLPATLVVENAYTPGIGLPVGKVLLVQGQVVIQHEDQPKGFYAKNDYPLFRGDTLITLDKGRIRIKLEDDSIITLASETKLVINKSVYDPDHKTRSSFIGMDKGKARFLVKKLVDFKDSEFKVKTKTAVAGVRGSEFIIIATDLFTEIFTLEDTRLEVISLASPCKDIKKFPPPPECEVKPLVLMDFEKTIVRLGELPTEPEIVTPPDLEQFDRDFIVTPDVGGPEGAIEIPSAKAGQYVPAEALQEPEMPVFGPIIDTQLSTPDFLQGPSPVNPSEAIIEDSSLPGFPGIPE